MLRGFSPAVTVVIFLALWSIVFFVMRHVAPELSRGQWKALTISFGVAIAALLVVILAFSLVISLG